MGRRRRPKDVEAVALWPGAGSSADHPSLVVLGDALDVPVFRIDFPYRREGRRAPDRAPKLMAAVRDDVASLCVEHAIDPGRLVIGGRSMGGRISSMVAAGADDEPPLTVAGVLLLAYPLHPPGKPERLRIEHLPHLRVPTLFVCGDRDPFGTPGELAEAQALVAGPVTSVTIAGGRHELVDADGAVCAAVRNWLGSSRR